MSDMLYVRPAMVIKLLTCNAGPSDRCASFNSSLVPLADLQLQ
jgi:hypothetical protein